MKITDTMVLALLKKNVVYAFEGAESDVDIDIPTSLFLGEEARGSMNVKIKCTVKSCSIEIIDED